MLDPDRDAPTVGREPGSDIVIARHSQRLGSTSAIDDHHLAQRRARRQVRERTRAGHPELGDRELADSHSLGHGLRRTPEPHAPRIKRGGEQGTVALGEYHDPSLDVARAHPGLTE